MEIVKHVVSKARKREDGQWEYNVVCIQCSLHVRLIQSLSLCVINTRRIKPHLGAYNLTTKWNEYSQVCLVSNDTSRSATVWAANREDFRVLIHVVDSSQLRNQK